MFVGAVFVKMQKYPVLEKSGFIILEWIIVSVYQIAKQCFAFNIASVIVGYINKDYVNCFFSACCCTAFCIFMLTN